MKRIAAALFMCAVMVMVVAVPLASGGEYIIVKGERGPRNSAVTWVFEPTDYGDWKATIDNHGLRWLVVDVYDNTSGVPEEIWHERIRFAAVDAYPIGLAYSSLVSMGVGHKYEITATPNGPRDSYAMVSDTFAKNEPPVAVMSTSMEFMVLTADGSRSYDHDGSIQAWDWDFGDGSTGTGSGVTHAYTAPGDYWVTLTVTDNLGAWDDETAMVSAQEKPNEPPMAAFTYTQEDLTVWVDGQTSEDNDGTVVSWAWNFNDESTASGVTATYTFATEGTKTVTLTVADDDGATDDEVKQIYVTMPVDDPPTAAFTWVASELVVNFDASDSLDDYGIVSYDWVFEPGMTGTGKTISYTFPADGTYPVTLTVTDTASQTGSITKDVKVATKKAPIADFSVTAVWLDVTVNGGASSDPDGTVVTWSWNFGDGMSGSGTTTTHSYASANTYLITLTVTDNDGLTGSLSKPVTVEEEPNLPPVALFTASADGDRLGSFDGGASYDPDGSVVAWAWNFGDGMTGVGKTTTHLYTADGTYDVTLTVTDNEGATGSLTKQLTVKYNNPPVASFTVTKTYLDILVNAAGSSDDGTIVTYAWNFGDSSTGTGVSKTHSYASGGTYTVSLLVTDDGGKTGTTSQQVTVAPNPPPVAMIALVSQTDLTVSVSGSGSTDDSAIASYAWNFGDGGTALTVDATHTYASAGTYTITLVVTDDHGASDSETLSVTVTLMARPSLDYKLYDMFEQPWGEWWNWRPTSWPSDYILSSEPHKNVLLYNKGSDATALDATFMLYAPYRWNITGKNLTSTETNVNVYHPEFWPKFGSDVPGAQAAMSIYMEYIDTEWWMNYWIPNWGEDSFWVGDDYYTTSDGYILGTVYEMKMNPECAATWLNIPVGSDPVTWWGANYRTYRTNWVSWVKSEGNTRLDIWCGYEYPYWSLGTMARLSVAPDGDIVFKLAHLSWGWEILLTRWLTESNLCTHEPWYEDTTINVGYDAKMINFTLDGVCQYSMHAVKANGTADGAAWVWEPQNVDYVVKSPHPSDYLPYSTLSYQSWNAGDTQFGNEIAYEGTPQVMDLADYQSLTIKLAQGADVIGYLGQGVAADAGAGLPGDMTPWQNLEIAGSMDLGYYFTNPADPLDLGSMYDPVTKTLTIEGAATFDNPRGGGLWYHGAPWIEFDVTPTVATKVVVETATPTTVSSGATTTSALVVLSIVGVIALGSLAVLAAARRPEEL